MTTTQKLVESCIPLANKLAYQAKRSLPRFVDIEELKSAAYLGLVEAGSRYKEEYLVAFSTFAYSRVFGAIRDYIKDQGWIRKGDLTPMISLDANSGNGRISIGETIEAKSSGNTEDDFNIITVNLDDKAKLVLRSYFIDDLSMKEVGNKFGVSESRISQLIKQYQNKIKDHWNESELVLELAA